MPRVRGLWIEVLKDPVLRRLVLRLPDEDWEATKRVIVGFSSVSAPDELLAHVAPLGWRHISLTGDYLWQNAAAELDQDGYRALNIAGGPGAKVA